MILLESVYIWIFTILTIHFSLKKNYIFFNILCYDNDSLTIYFPSIYSAFSWSKRMLRTAVPCLATMLEPLLLNLWLKLLSHQFQNYAIAVTVNYFSFIFFAFASCLCPSLKYLHLNTFGPVIWGHPAARKRLTFSMRQLVPLYVRSTCHSNISNDLNLCYLIFNLVNTRIAPWYTFCQSAFF
jgi:hypothetical protein